MSGAEKIAAGFVTGIIGLAVIATLVSKKSKTPQVLGATGHALSGSLTAAEGG
jgi:hypothetical protein